MEKLIENILKKAKEDKKVLAVALFGSKARKEPNKDIDICIILNKKHDNLEMSNIIISYLGIAKEKVDLSIFQQLPLYIRMRILKEGKILMVKNESALYDLAFSTIKEFDSYKKLYYMYLKEVGNGSRKNIIKN
ncbi:nucleotidyltransferase domain-containing protein [Candidatus Pacearchaeota archaeon]|nr:nucleotidyltransferase domain-containing protein [Candidatus Pacearchaeota archaeon]